MTWSLKGWRTTRRYLRNTFRLEDGSTNILPDRHLYLATTLQQRHFVRCAMCDVQCAMCNVRSSSVDSKCRLSRRQPHRYRCRCRNWRWISSGDVVGGALSRRRTVACLTGVINKTILPRCVHRQSQDNNVTLLPGGSVHCQRRPYTLCANKMGP
jgi:hypothetical protein